MNIAKLQGIKLIKRNHLHSYTLTMKNGKEIKETTPTKITKYQEINLPKDTKDL